MDSIVEKNILETEATETATIIDIAAAMENAMKAVAIEEASNKNPDEVNADIYKLVMGEYIYREFTIGDLTFKIADMKIGDINTMRNFILNNLKNAPRDYIDRFSTKMNYALSIHSVMRGDEVLISFKPFPSDEKLNGDESEKYIKQKSQILVERQNYIDKMPPPILQRILEESIVLNKYIQAIIKPEVISNF
jgi:hypothetical protein